MSKKKIFDPEEFPYGTFKCPNCGAIIDGRAMCCPICGCPLKYFWVTKK